VKAKAKPKKKPRRVVLGVGHPWFYFDPDYIGLTKIPVAPSILLRRFDWADLHTARLGNWNKIRLVAEVLK
jgi:hypothetical protein